MDTLNKSRVSLYLTPNLKNILQENAKKRGLSINTVIITLIEKEFEKEIREKESLKHSD
jgi:hypothetical protein